MTDRHEMDKAKDAVITAVDHWIQLAGDATTDLGLVKQAAHEIVVNRRVLSALQLPSEEELLRWYSESSSIDDDASRTAMIMVRGLQWMSENWDGDSPSHVGSVLDHWASRIEEAHQLFLEK